MNLLDASTHPGTILVVEDDLQLRRAIERALHNGGYCVELASDGDGAIAMLATHGDSLRAVYLDLQLPGTPGERVFTYLRTLYPTLPVVVASGDDLSLMEFIDFIATEFLPKPFLPKELQDAFGRALGSQQKPPRQLVPTVPAARWSEAPLAP